MKKLVIILVVLSSLTTSAQKNKRDSTRNLQGEIVSSLEEDNKTNLFTGGSLSFGLSSYGFNAGLHPHFGYTLTKWIDVAAVVNFEYNSQRDQFDGKYHSTTFGIGAFTRIYPVKFAFIQIQPEINNLNFKYFPSGGAVQKASYSVPSLLVGIGYTPSRSSKNTFSYFTLMLDILKKENSPYVDGRGNSTPIIRAGYNIGLFQNRKRY